MFSDFGKTTDVTVRLLPHDKCLSKTLDIHITRRCKQKVNVITTHFIFNWLTVYGDIPDLKAWRSKETRLMLEDLRKPSYL
jgi:hypothetical protein